MKKLSILTLTMIALTSFMATTVRADSPHFIDSKTGASGIDADGNVTVKFKIAGLGAAVSTTVTTTADAKAIYACENRGGKCPNAANKQEVTGTVTASDDFTSDKNGSISNSLTLTPPAGTLDCPGGQQLILVNVTYSNVQVSEPSAGNADITGSFARTFVSGDCATQFGL